MEDVSMKKTKLLVTFQIEITHPPGASVTAIEQSIEEAIDDMADACVEHLPERAGVTDSGLCTVREIA